MQKISFELININLDDTIERIYSGFSFYFVEAQADIEVVFYDFIKKCKFMTFSILYEFDTKKILTSINDSTINFETSSFPNIVNAIFCTEEKCIIIQKINMMILKKIIKKLEENDIITLNASSDSFLIDMENNSQISEELSNFLDKYDKKIRKNQFVRITIRSIMSYMIRRYFQPTNNFNNNNFFEFGDPSNTKEKNLKSEFYKFFQTSSTNDDENINLNEKSDTLSSKDKCEDINLNEKSDTLSSKDKCEDINLNEKSDTLSSKDKCEDINLNENTLENFMKSDFIILRKIYNNNNFTFNLVFHMKTFHIFMQKEINDNIKNPDIIMKNEIYFCQNYSHRCFTPFYGFLRDRSHNIIGFIYKYLCNGSLKAFIESDHKNYDELFQLNAISRISQGINYIHSNSLIYRDLKPLNILLDNDFIPYIIDFETIRHPFDSNESPDICMTSDIGCQLYSSPEQNKFSNSNVSYPSDIYSFGLVVYFILEKKDLLSDINSLMNSDFVEKIKFINSSINMQNLIKNCLKYDPGMRISIKDIMKILEKEISSFLILEKYVLKDEASMNISNIIQFLYENSLLLNDIQTSDEKIENILKISFFQKLFSVKKNESLFYYLLGKYYFHGLNQKQDIIKAKKYFELSAKHNNPDALFFLGELYYNGNTVKQDYLKAKEYYELAAKQNHSDALFNLGGLYYDGFGVEKDYLKAKEYYELAAKQNNSNALLNLGCLYYDGFGVEKDYLKAKEYFELSSKLNNSNANVNLGYYYFDGKEGEKNINKALKYFEMAAKQKNTKAMVFLGIQYSEGTIFERNYLKAKEYFENAAKLNDPYALMRLGSFYEYNILFEQDYSKAKEYYELAAKQNYPFAFAFLGFLYKEGKGVKQDYLKAKEYFELGAEQSNSTALLGLGSLYLDGLGVKQNYATAKYYIELSAMQNNLNALLSLGNMYIKGIGVEQNIKKGIKYIELSANQNNADAQLVLGNHYYLGDCVKKDYKKAMEYFKLAAKQNNSDAFLSLGNIYYNGNGVKQNFETAKNYYELAAKQNNSNAFLNLGHMYFNGESVKKDHYKAMEYYELSAKQKNKNALFSLGYMYLYGFGTPKDYLKAKDIFEQLAKLNNSNGLDHLGLMYENGYGVKQDYLKAKEYYELAANSGNSRSYVRLGDLFFCGKGVNVDYLKAKEYYEKASMFHNSNAEFKIGFFYLNGFGVNKSLLKAQEYLELSASKNNAKALFILACCYSEGNEFEINLTKSIDYFQKCSQIQIETVITNDPDLKVPIARYSSVNEFKYLSMNNLGLLYITASQDIEKGIEYIKESAFAEFPFAQNNYGIIFQFYLNKIENAQHMYGRASEHNFSLSEFNIGHMFEKDNNIKEAIKYYIKASNDENKPLEFHGKYHLDKRLLLSNIFIICLTNLKLVLYYLTEEENYIESEYYFVKSLCKLIFMTGLTPQYRFQFQFDRNNSNNIFIYIKKFILYSPCFSLFNQPNLPEDLVWNEEFEDYNSSMPVHDDLQSDIICSPLKLFSLMINDSFLKNSFVDQIKDIIVTMEKILYAPPYCILFGRISIEHFKIKKQINTLKDVNNQFYEGLNINSIE